MIFTMRSDFISQCTVFKHLPEFIAYSQFFVPQLKRDEIRQVIEEPAVLAGLKVAMIPGDENNYKITTKKDLDRFMQDSVGN